MSSTEALPTDVAINRDAAALIALWLQIYGGDPPPRDFTVSPAAGLSAAALVAQLNAELGGSDELLSDKELDSRLSRLGLTLGDGHEHAEAEITKNGAYTCVRGPDDAPGCCVLMQSHITFHGGGGGGTDNP